MSIFENRISGIQKFTTLDFPGLISGILFYSGCKLRCPYCYNPEVVFNRLPHLSVEEITDFLKARKNVLDGIVLCGGECTLYGEDLIDDINYLHSLGYKVKMDTNGVNYGIIKKIVKNKLVEYIALDYKCPEEKWDMFFPNKDLYTEFEKTLKLLINSDVPFEVRTTVHPDCTDEHDINMMIDHLETMGYSGTYYLQYFMQCPATIGNVNQNPREFDLSKLLDTKHVKFSYRNFRTHQ